MHYLILKTNVFSGGDRMFRLGSSHHFFLFLLSKKTGRQFLRGRNCFPEFTAIDAPCPVGYTRRGRPAAKRPGQLGRVAGKAPICHPWLYLADFSILRV